MFYKVNYESSKFYVFPFDIMIGRPNHNSREYGGGSKALHCEMFMLTVKPTKALCNEMKQRIRFEINCSKKCGS